MLADIDTWVLDLDNTLYPAGSALAEQLTHGILSTIARHYRTDLAGARRIQAELVAEYGTSLRGAMLTGTIDPHEFLDFERRMDYSVIGPDPALAEVLAAMTGRKYIYTNGSAYHAEQALGRLGITDAVDDVFDILAADLVPKPYAASLDAFLTRFGVEPARTVMFDDLEVNLEVPYQRGMATVLIRADAPYEQLADRRWRAPDMPGFLQAVANI